MTVFTSKTILATRTITATTVLTTNYAITTGNGRVVVCSFSFGRRHVTSEESSRRTVNRSEAKEKQQQLKISGVTRFHHRVPRPGHGGQSAPLRSPSSMLPRYALRASMNSGSLRLRALARRRRRTGHLLWMDPMR